MRVLIETWTKCRPICFTVTEVGPLQLTVLPTFSKGIKTLGDTGVFKKYLGVLDLEIFFEFGPIFYSLGFLIVKIHLGVGTRKHP